MVDSDLAELYEVPTKRLNEQVHRNRKRFPADFMFRLRSAEAKGLRSQIATSKDGRGGRRYLPLVFTEQGVAMLSSVLNSDRSIQVNIAIMRAFVRLRVMLVEHRDLAAKVTTLEKDCEIKFQAVFQAIRHLSAPPVPKRKPIGFLPATSSSPLSSGRALAAGSGRSS